jgi:hypothetical protein
VHFRLCFAGTVCHNAGSVCLFQKVLIINVGQEFTNKWMNSMYMYMCMCVCMYVCMYVCVCVYIYTHIHIYLTWIEVHKLKILFLTIYDRKVCSFPHFELISVLYLFIENTLVNILCISAWTGHDEWVSQLGCSMHLGANELVFITLCFMVWCWSMK